MVEWIKKSNVR